MSKPKRQSPAAWTTGIRLPYAERMRRAPVGFLIVTVAALAFWESANRILGVTEPWDSPGFFSFYLAALGLCAAFGYLFPERSWRWGVIVVFAQLPVMMRHPNVGASLLPVGLLFLTGLALPAVVAATFTSHLRERQRSRASDR
jgi:hypothetical protein